jgi:hypothetical protein
MDSFYSSGEEKHEYHAQSIIQSIFFISGGSSSGRLLHQFNTRTRMWYWDAYHSADDLGQNTKEE